MKIFLSLFLLLFLFSGKQDDPLASSMKRGQEIYQDFCINCHMQEGEGVPGAFPPLAGADFLLNNREASIHAVKYGQKGEIVVNGETYNNIMTPLYLADEEVVDVMNFILNSWGNKGEIVTLEEVEAVEE
ncbi:MAG: cytochrome c [Saprospiraceae bacterium]|nr:cytochrome c [Saprospiraceae bacterium]